MKKLGYRYYFEEIDKNLSKKIITKKNVINIIDIKFNFKKTFDKITDKSNKYIDEQAPWNLKKDDTERMNVVLYCLLESIRQIGILIQPIMPSSANKILDIFGLDSSQRFFNKLDSKLVVGTDLIKQDVMFPRIENQ